MSEHSAQADAASRRRAILFVLGSSASFTVAAALVKVAAGDVPTMEIVFFRNVCALVAMLPLMVRFGLWTVLYTRQPIGHLARGLAGLGSMYSSFYGYAHLPLAVVTALGFSMPIFLALLSVPLLGEKVTAWRGVSIGAGFLGVLLVMRPWQGVGGLPLAETAVVVGGVALWAGAMVSIRRMGKAGERNVTIVSLFAVFGTMASGLAVVPVWVTPLPWIWVALIGVGLVSAAAQLLMTEGYRSGEASMLAPFEYSAIFYTRAMGWGIWGEVPGAWEVAGIAVLVVSGLLTWWRETRAG